MDQINQNHSTENALLAILSSAKEAGVNSLSRTELIKYLYLLDVYVAEDTSGTKWTDVSWKFFHYGPYSTDVMHSIDYLVSKSWVKEESKQIDNKDFFLYELESRGDLNISKIPNAAMSRLIQAIKTFRSNLSKLLNFVYFKTEPMMLAIPGDTLDFSSCRKFELGSVKPIPMKPLNQSKVNELREKRQQKLSKKQDQLSKLSFKGRYDEIYLQAMSTEDDHQGLEEINGRALIGF